MKRTAAELEEVNSRNSKRPRTDPTMMKEQLPLLSRDELLAVITEARNKYDDMASLVTESVPEDLWTLVLCSCTLQTVLVVGRVSQYFNNLCDRHIQIFYSHLYFRYPNRISKLTHLTHLSVRPTMEFQHVSGLTNLKSLSILTQLRPVSSFPCNIQRLKLTGTCNSQALVHLQHLTFLCAHSLPNNVVLPKLHTLHLQQHSRLEKFSEWPNLRHLRVKRSNLNASIVLLTQLTELLLPTDFFSKAPLTCLTNLTSLGPPHDYPLEQLAYFPNLEKLTLAYSSNYEPISVLTNLTYLNCSKFIFSGDYISNMTRLHTIKEAGRSFRESEIPVSVRKLTMCNEWRSLESVFLLTNLTHLQMDCKRPPLGLNTLQNLTFLDLRSSHPIPVTDLQSLTNLQSLSSLTSHINTEILNYLPKLTYLAHLVGPGTPAIHHDLLELRIFNRNPADPWLVSDSSDDAEGDAIFMA